MQPVLAPAIDQAVDMRREVCEHLFGDLLILVLADILKIIEMGDDKAARVCNAPFAPGLFYESKLIDM